MPSSLSGPITACQIDIRTENKRFAVVILGLTQIDQILRSGDLIGIFGCAGAAGVSAGQGGGVSPTGARTGQGSP